MITSNQAKPEGKTGTGNKNPKTSPAQSFKERLIFLYTNIEKFFATNVYYDTMDKVNKDILAYHLLNCVQEGETILEIGLNPGILSLECSRKAAICTGIDNSPKHVVIAENLKHIENEKFEYFEKIENINLNSDKVLDCKFSVMNPESPGFKEETFNKIFCNNAIKEGNITPILENAQMLLKSGGELLLKFSIPNKMEINNPGKKGEHIAQKLDIKSLAVWADNNGFQIINKDISYIPFINNIVNELKFLKFNPLLVTFQIEFFCHLKKEVTEG